MPKPTVDELRAINILQWQDIQAHFTGSDLYLGNGFSIKISPMLNYGRLFDRFLENRTPSDRIIFNSFGTTNFEFILERLTNAIAVNNIFNQPVHQITDSVTVLRNGLVEAINQNHPRFHDLNDATFQSLSVALDQFRDIYTTNYDTFLYRIILKTLDRNGLDQNVVYYQDYFRRRQGVLTFLDTENDPDAKNIYFLHGALFIFQTPDGHFKIRRGGQNTELIDLISARINAQEFPLFVSEGTSQDKANKINRSAYLSFCRTNFRKARRQMVIYGSSLSDQDAHFISDLNTYKRDLAISMRCEGKTIPQLQAERTTLISKFNHLIDERVEVFDSDGLF